MVRDLAVTATRAHRVPSALEPVRLSDGTADDDYPAVVCSLDTHVLDRE
jgi:hypothetical protein